MSTTWFVTPKRSPWSMMRVEDGVMRDDEGPPPDLADQIDHALAYVRQRATAVNAQTERVGDTVEMRCALARGAEPLEGHLVLSFYKTATHAFFQAQLPAGTGEFQLSPQSGLLGWIDSLAERELGQKAVDDAYVVKGDEGGLETLRRVPLTLLRAAPLQTRITATDDRFNLVCARVPPFEEMLGRVLDVVQDLWPLVVERRLQGAG
jgi:hypothetical protein